MRGFSLRAAIATLAMLTLAACQLRELENDLVDAADLRFLGGRVDVAGWDGSPIRVVVWTVPEDERAPIRVTNTEVLTEPGVFAFLVDPNAYFVGAHVDVDGDERYDPEEPAVLVDEPVLVTATRDETDVRLRISRPLDRPPIDPAREVLDDRTLQIGTVVSLSDARFSPKAGRAGLWSPIRSLEEYRPGVYFLEEYDDTKTPVLFVHGMLGYAQEFEAFIDGLDARRFQAWVFQYPSAFPLRQVSSTLQRSLTTLKVRHGLDRVCVVAHSMGGLVARRLLRWRAAGEPLVRALVTIASPLGGMASAESGVSMAPVVVPSWYDLVPDGDFLRELYDRPLPAGVEYQLLFTYQDQGANDGTVALRSQLRAEAQAEATLVRGYDASHTGALRDPDVAAQVGIALDRCRGDRPDGPLVAPRPSLVAPEEPSQAASR